MRQLKIIFILIILNSCSNNNEQKSNNIETSIETKIIEENAIKVDTVSIENYLIELEEWLNYYGKYSMCLEDFDFLQQDSLPDVSVKVDSFELINDIYYPYYKYSIDSTKILDLISYNLILEKNEKNELVSAGSSVDNEVSIKDLKKKIWKRILFVGPFYLIEDGFWINNNQLLIVGENNETEQDIYKPIIWFVDLKSNIIQTFVYNDYIDNMNCDYRENVKYKDIKVTE